MADEAASTSTEPQQALAVGTQCSTVGSASRHIPVLPAGKHMCNTLQFDCISSPCTSEEDILSRCSSVATKSRMSSSSDINSDISSAADMILAPHTPLPRQPQLAPISPVYNPLKNLPNSFQALPPIPVLRPLSLNNSYQDTTLCPADCTPISCQVPSYASKASDCTSCNNPRSSGSNDSSEQSAITCPLLTLPDTLLVSLWDLLDKNSRQALYHSCKDLWSGHAFNACLTSTVVHNNMQDLLTFPRHASRLERLRFVNVLQRETAGKVPSTPDHQPTNSNSVPTAEELLSCSLVRFLHKAREEPKAVELLGGLSTLVLQGRGRDRVLCKRLGCLLGSLSPGLQSLQLDWVCMNMETCSSLACWLSLTHLSLVSVNSQDVHGNWPSYTVTYNDIGLLTSLQRLEIIDSHLPFLELGVSDISGLTSLTRLESLHLVYSERAHGWPGSKPCYLLLGLDEVSVACDSLKELVLDGVQVAKLVRPSWPSLTTLCLGFISGIQPSLFTALQLDCAAPRLKRISLGPIKCNLESADAHETFKTRLLNAMRSMAMTRAAPRHLELLLPPGFITAGSPAGPLLSAMAPMGSHLYSLSLEMDFLCPGDAQALAAALPRLQSLTLNLTDKECGMALSELLEVMPDLDFLQVTNCGSRLLTSQALEPMPDGNVLALCYAAYSVHRRSPLTLYVRQVSAFAATCINELKDVTPASGQPIEILCNTC